MMKLSPMYYTEPDDSNPPFTRAEFAQALALEVGHGLSMTTDWAVMYEIARTCNYSDFLEVTIHELQLMNRMRDRLEGCYGITSATPLAELIAMATAENSQDGRTRKEADQLLLRYDRTRQAAAQLLLIVRQYNLRYSAEDMLVAKAMAGVRGFHDLPAMTDGEFWVFVNSLPALLQFHGFTIHTTDAELTAAAGAK